MFVLGPLLHTNVAAMGAAAVGTTWDGANGTNVADWALTNGNLTATRTATSGFNGSIRSTTADTNGTILITITAIGTTAFGCFVGLDTGVETAYPGNDNTGHSIGYRNTDGGIYFGNASIATGATFTTGDVIKIIKSGVNVSFYKNNALQATIDTSSVAYGNGPVMAGTAYVMGYNGNGTGTALTLDASGW